MRNFTKTVLLVSLFASSVSSEEERAFRALEPLDEMVDQTRWVVSTINRKHYLRGSINELDGREIIESFIDSQDYTRMYFLEKDIENFAFRFADAVESFLDRGNLYPAFEIFKAFRERSAARNDWVMERLEGDFDFTADETFAPDRREAEWAKTTEELDELWNGRLKFELLNELLSADGGSVDSASGDETAVEEEEEPDETRQRKIRRLLEDETYFAEVLEEAKDALRRRYSRNLRYVMEREASEIQESFLNSMTRIFDPHSTFFSSDTLDDFNTAVQNSFVGIGALLEDVDGYCTIKELLPGGPAEQSGDIGPEDQILAVGQGRKGEYEDVIDMKLKHIVKKIKGKKGTTVRLLIRPGDAADPSVRKEVLLVRDEIKLTANLANARIISVPLENGESVPVGVLELPSFYGNIGAGGTLSNTSDDVLELIGKLKDAGIKGLVLDLRSNGGGLLSEAVRVAGLFIPTGPIVQVRDVSGRTDVLNDSDPQIAWDGPLVVLTSRFSASASEIVAGALRDHERALIVGDSATHGKGTVQEVFKMHAPRSGFSFIAMAPNQRTVATKITIKQFYLPDGSSTQLKGVSSDISLPSANEFLPIGESDLPHAIAWGSIEDLGWTLDWPNLGVAAADNPEMVESLISKSEERQNTLEEFALLKKQIDWRRGQRERKEFSLNLQQRIERQLSENKFIDTMEDSYDTLSENDFESTGFVLDVTAEQEEKSRSSGNGYSETDDDEDGPFDIHLRESVRIIADWVMMLQSSKDQQIASKGD